jgi:hypothetical protein
MKFVMAGPEKMWPFNAGDCLIEVSAWACLTVFGNYVLKFITMSSSVEKDNTVHG